MASLTSTNVDIKAAGGSFNTRVQCFERKVDFAKINLASGTQYEFLDLPKGFIADRLAIVNIGMPFPGEAVVSATLKSDSAKTVSASLTGTGTAFTFATAAIAAGSADGDVVCLNVAPALEKGVVAVRAFGKYVTGYTDEAMSADMTDVSACHIHNNTMIEPEADSSAEG